MNAIQKTPALWRHSRNPLARTLGLMVTMCICTVVVGMWVPARAKPATSLADLMALCITGAPDDSGFTSENNAAMLKMMYDMTVEPSGNIDRDFAAMMIPHHQGAIEMAQAELRHGSNEQLRRIAQGIIVEQQQEIVAMRLALDQPLPPSAPAPTQAKPF
jgi:Domain of unknown function (DUF305)